MKRWIVSFFLVAVFMPHIATAIESEKDAIEAIGKTLDKLWISYHEDCIDVELYEQTAQAILEIALTRYPQSVKLHTSLQNLPYVRVYDEDAEAEEEVVRDSIFQAYRFRWEENPRSPLDIYLYARLLDDYEEMGELAEKIIKTNPDYYWGHYLLALALNRQKKYQEAIPNLKKAIGIDSTEGAFNSLAYFYYQTQQYDEAFAAAVLGYSLPPKFGGNYRIAKNATRELGNYDLVLELERNVFMALPEEKEDVLYGLTETMISLSYAFRALGELDSTRYYLDVGYGVAAILGEDRQMDFTYHMACLEGHLGKKDAAFEVLEELVDKGYANYRRVIRDIDFDSLRDDVRYDNLIARMKDAKRIELLEWIAEIADAEYNEGNYGHLMGDLDFELVKDDAAYQTLVEKMGQVRKKHILSERIDEPAPDFTLVSLEGDTVTLSALRGKPVFLDFWGLGCGPCRRAIPYLQEFYEKHKDEVYVIGIESWDSGDENIREYLQEQGVTYPNLLGNEEVTKAYGVRGVPNFFVIDNKGNIAFSHTGFAPGMEAEWEWYLDAVVE